MRDFRTFANDPVGNDPAAVDYIGATNINNFLGELEAAVTRSGQTLSSDDGTDDADKTQLAKSLFLHSVKAQQFQDNGSANTYQLTPISGSGGVLLPASYAQMDGARAWFVPAFANSGNSTINIGQTTGTLLGAKKALNYTGAELAASALTAGKGVAFVYSAAADTGAGAWLLDPASIPTGSAGGDLTGTYPNPTLAASGVTPGSAGGGITVPAISVDTKGRITSLINTNIDFATTGGRGVVQLSTAAQARSKVGSTAITASNLADIQFESAEIAIVQATTANVPHGLGVKPSEVSVYIRCKTAEGGFSVGEEVKMGWNYTLSGLEYGVIASIVDSTNVSYTVGDRAPAVYRRDAPVGDAFPITPANWRIVLRARA